MVAFIDFLGDKHLVDTDQITLQEKVQAGGFSVNFSPQSFLVNFTNRPFAASDHVVQNRPCWRASSLLFPQWDIKTKRPEPVKLDLPLF